MMQVPIRSHLSTQSMENCNHPDPENVNVAKSGRNRYMYIPIIIHGVLCRRKEFVGIMFR